MPRHQLGPVGKVLQEALLRRGILQALIALLQCRLHLLRAHLLHPHHPLPSLHPHAALHTLALHAKRTVRIEQRLGIGRPEGAGNRESRDEQDPLQILHGASPLGATTGLPPQDSPARATFL